MGKLVPDCIKDFGFCGRCTDWPADTFHGTVSTLADVRLSLCEIVETFRRVRNP